MLKTPLTPPNNISLAYKKKKGLKKIKKIKVPVLGVTFQKL